MIARASDVLCVTFKFESMSRGGMLRVTGDSAGVPEVADDPV